MALLDSVDDSTAGGVVGGDGQSHLVAKDNSNPILAHLTRQVRENEQTGIQTHSEHSAGKHFLDNPVQFNVIRFWHSSYFALDAQSFERSNRILF
jgi:hypothetical protein